MSKILREQIDLCISQCTSFIASSSRHINREYGWHQHLGTNKIGIVASAMVLLYYKKLGLECPGAPDAIEFIKSKAKTEQNRVIGWPYISNTHGQSNVESTCWALLALHEYAADECSTMIGQGVEWILSQHQDFSYSDNGWGFTTESKPRIYITAFVLRTLRKLGRTGSEEYESAFKWLKNAQNDDGGWGELPDSGSSIFYTSYVIISLLECGMTTSHKIIRKAKHWLDERMDILSVSDSALLCYMEFIESGTAENRSRITFFHYVSAYVIQAYSKLDYKSPNLYKALETCVTNCVDGTIEHPMLENSKIVPVWAIYDTVTAFKTWEENYSEWNEIYQFSIQFNRIRALRKYNPLRLLPSNLQWVLNGLLLSIIIWTILHFFNPIMTWLDSTTYSGWGQIMISFTASSAYGTLGYLGGRLFSKLFGSKR